MTIRYGAHCTQCVDPPPFTDRDARDTWVDAHPHPVLTSTEHRP